MRKILRYAYQLSFSLVCLTFPVLSIKFLEIFSAVLIVSPPGICHPATHFVLFFFRLDGGSGRLRILNCHCG